MSSDSRRWVPITKSTSPVRKPPITALLSLGVRKRLSISTRIGYGANLISVGGSLECGSNCDLGLPETYVAEHQAVHCLVRLHVRFHLLDGGELIRRLLIGEGTLHFLLPWRIRSETVALGLRPSPVQGNNLFGDGGDLLAHPVLRLLPVRSAHPRHPGLFPAGVLLDRRQLISGNVKPVLAGISNDQVVPFDSGDAAADQSFEPADPAYVPMP